MHIVYTTEASLRSAKVTAEASPYDDFVFQQSSNIHLALNSSFVMPENGHLLIPDSSSISIPIGESVTLYPGKYTYDAGAFVGLGTVVIGDLTLPLEPDV